MNNKQESRFGMLRDASEHIMLRIDLIKDLPECEKNFTMLRGNIDEIDKITKVQSYDKTGLAQEKKQMREVLILLSADMSKKLTAFAMLGNKTVLEKEAAFTKSKLQNANDTIVYEYAQMIYDKAQENLDSLGAFGISQETQSVLQNTINAYKTLIGKPRLGQKEKKEATERLAELFRDSDLLLDKIDAVMYLLKDKQPSFYKRYRELRKVVVTGTGSLALKATAFESPSGIPVSGARFVFYPEGALKSSGNGEIVKKTAEKGNFYLKSIPEGIYTVKITKTGYKEKEMKVTVVNGKMVELEVEMEVSN